MPPIIPAPNDIPGDNDEPGNLTSAGFPLESGMVVMLSDSESDGEGWDHDGYEPLSQDPLSLFSHEFMDDEQNLSDAEEPVASGENKNTFRITSPDSPPTMILESEIIESSRRTIPMTPEHIDKIKSVMKDITLPKSSVPEWANHVPEEEWKKIIVTTYTSRPKDHYTIFQGGNRYPGPSTSSDKSDMSSDVLR